MPIYHNGYISDVCFGDVSIAEIYYGRSLVYRKSGGGEQWCDTFFESESGTYTHRLTATGNYKIIIRGAGGSGGQNSVNRNGGAGGKGQLNVYTYNCTQRNEQLTIHIGENGLTKANGGNGGTSLGDYPSGDGGGGAKPTYILKSDGSLLVYALGGGGGGGAGRNAISGGRYQTGASGGAGGGYYRFNTETLEIEDVAGKDGPVGAGRGGGAIGGYSGNITDFPDLRGGSGSAGGGSGGGASGGSGSNGGNHTSSTGGPGGAGAGGDLDAGGGEYDGYNHHITPTNIYMENFENFIIGDYGTGGKPNENGDLGCVKIIYQGHHSVDGVDDYGLITDEESSVEYLGCIVKMPYYYRDYGSVNGNGGRANLPQGYQELAYITTTGTQYIDTGVYGHKNTAFKMKYSNVMSGQQGIAFGSRASATESNISVITSGGSTILDFGTYQQTRMSGSHRYGDIVEVYSRYNYRYVKDVTTDILFTNTGVYTGEDFTTPFTLRIAQKTDGYLSGHRNFIGNIYMCQIWDGDELVRDFVPVERMSDHTIGMYDTVNDVFYENAGTDEFGYGELQYDYGTLGTTESQEDFGKVYELEEVEEIINNGEI